MPPEDDFRRDIDPRTRSNAIVVGGRAGRLPGGAPGGRLGGAQPTHLDGARRRPRGARHAPAIRPRRRSPTRLSARRRSRPSRSWAPASAPRTTRSTHQLVAFGGVDSYDTTWLWDGRRWTLARPARQPAGRFNAAAAYDPLTGVVMLYGGRLGPGQLVQDTWAWDGGTWHQLDAGTSSLPS